MHNFPRQLKELRQENNLSQMQLANALGYKSAVTINQWETGKRTPGLETLIAIARFFKVSLDTLAGNE